MGRASSAWLGLAASVLVLGACGDGSVATSAGDEVGEGELAAVLEPFDTVLTDPGAGWEEVGRWVTEGSMTDWTTGCPEFDRLGDIFNHGSPQTVVWQRGGDLLYQRTDDVGWEAGAFAVSVEAVPEGCPTVGTDQGPVTTSSADLGTLAPGAEEVGTDDPSTRVVGLALDAYPVPSLETDLFTPEFLVDRPTWMVVTTRHNVVSQLVYSPDPGSGSDPAGLDALVVAQLETLADAPIQARGPFARAAPPPSVERQTVTDAELFVDAFTCRNDGGVTVDGISWRLTEPIPFEWRERNPILGEMTMEGTEATFSAHPGPPPIPGEDTTDVDGEAPPLDGFTVRLTTGATDAGCDTWEQEPDPDPANSVGRLDCGDDGVLTEERFPDTGQRVEDLAADATPHLASVEEGDPLQWWGIDTAGEVVVGLFLGDVDEPDWQVVTCRPGP